MKNILSFGNAILDSSSGSFDILIACLVFVGAICFLIFAIWFTKVSKKKKQDSETRRAELFRKNSFNATNVFVSQQDKAGNTEALYVDGRSRQLAVVRIKGNKENIRILPFKKLIGYEIYQNDEKKAVNGSGDAMLAGLLFGGLTALAVSNAEKGQVKVCASLEVHLKLNELPALEIFSFLATTVPTSSETYVNALKRAKEFASALEHILKDSEATV